LKERIRQFNASQATLDLQAMKSTKKVLKDLQEEQRAEA
jgi:hypothetical protein